MKLNETDIQGFVLRGYNMPNARYIFLHFENAAAGKALLGKLTPEITTGRRWEKGKPNHTTNIALSYRGMEALDVPYESLASFAEEFQQGMRARGSFLGDTGQSAPEFWDQLWREGDVHAWLAVHALSAELLAERCESLLRTIAESGSVEVLGTQDAATQLENGKVLFKEHFGYTDGFGNPDYVDIQRNTQPGQGKLNSDGTWSPLATGELLLGYIDEAGEIPPPARPVLLGMNGTYMVYRKLRQYVGTFEEFLETWGSRYGAGDAFAREKLASKLVGRWRDGTPVELSPDGYGNGIAQHPMQSTNFTYGHDLGGARCPMGAHIRRTNPRDAFGFDGQLINRRRISRRGMPYGPYATDAEKASMSPAELDAVDRGMIFIALNSDFARQFEFVQQQWIAYGNDAHLGNEKDPLFSNHAPGDKYSIQGDEAPANPPFFSTDLPNFVNLRGGEYFFVPSITSLAMLAMGLVDPS